MEPLAPFSPQKPHMIIGIEIDGVLKLPLAPSANRRALLKRAAVAFWVLDSRPSRFRPDAHPFEPSG